MTGHPVSVRTRQRCLYACFPEERQFQHAVDRVFKNKCSLPDNLWLLVSQLENIYWAPALQASLGETKMAKIKPGHLGAGRLFSNGKTGR